MKVISWNIRGLNSKGKQRYPKERLKTKKPQVMLIQETKVSSQKLENIVHSFKPHFEVVAIDSRGMAGGIAILWNPAEIIVEGWIGLSKILTSSFRQIGTKEKIIISAVYGLLIPRERGTFLQSIRTLHNMQQEKYWLLGGDFNMLLNLTEKKRWNKERRTRNGTL